MSANRPSRQDLADFLKRATRGDAPLCASSHTGVVAIRNNLSCVGDLADFLTSIADTPPSEMLLYKSGERSIVGTLPSPDGTPVVLKYYQPGRFYKHLTYGILGSRCMRSWLAGLAFQYLDLPTPTPLLVAEKRGLGGIWFSWAFLATNHAPGVDLRTWLNLHSDSPDRLAAMAGCLHDAFTRMARYGINHGDPKASNIIIADDDSFSFIDLDAVDFLSTGRRWKRLRERDRSILNNIVSKHPAAATAFDRMLREF